MQFFPVTPFPLLHPADCGAFGERTLPEREREMHNGEQLLLAAEGLRLLAEGGGEVVHGVAAGAKVGAGVLDALREAAYLESAVLLANRHEEELAAGMVERHLHIRFSGAGISGAPHCTKPSFRKQP